MDSCVSDVFSLKTYHYELPSELIAQSPAEPRDHSRLLVSLPGEEKDIIDSQFFHLHSFLPPKALIIGNQSRVYPARLRGQKSTGGKVQILCHKMENWEVSDKGLIIDVLVGANHKKHQGDLYFFPENKKAILFILEEGMRLLLEDFVSIEDFVLYLGRCGEVPLPPYIKETTSHDVDDYQTCYAKKDFFNDHLSTSCAAPTAGLHFTPELQKSLEEKGHEFVYLTLNVGLGTFTPVSVGDIREHPMHYEMYYFSPALAEQLNQALSEGRPLVAIGTTALRALSASFDRSTKKFKATPKEGAMTNIFIHPGSELADLPKEFLSGLITNFHLPESTLFMLICALVGLERGHKIYRHACEQRYRFFSYGDASFLKL
jgi:S-adenosylmethionine:tRNA ribosyltransferase-isomerase